MGSDSIVTIARTLRRALTLLQLPGMKKSHLATLAVIAIAFTASDTAKATSCAIETSYEILTLVADDGTTATLTSGGEEGGAVLEIAGTKAETFR